LLAVQYVADARRGNERRRSVDRRLTRVSDSVDVTRIEHENLYNQVMDNVRALRRIEAEITVIRAMLERRAELKDVS
jgi:hypothetical protein